MAQAAHAATAVLAAHKDLPEVKSYLADLGNMRKVVMEVRSSIQNTNVELIRGRSRLEKD
jgi:hypothetical protein